MKCFFYYSSTCFPYPVLAAAMHLGMLPNKPPFDSFDPQQIPVWIPKRIKGKPYLTGRDRLGNLVYVLWNAGEGDMVRKIIFSFLEVYRIPGERVVFLDLNIKDNLLSLTANTLMRFPPTTPWGKALIQKILQDCYPIIAGTVSSIKSQNLTTTANYQIMLP